MLSHTRSTSVLKQIRTEDGCMSVEIRGSIACTQPQVWTIGAAANNLETCILDVELLPNIEWDNRKVVSGENVLSKRLQNPRRPRQIL